MISALDHLNIRTARLADMRAWYSDVLGLVDGDRPPFPFGGAWLYAGEHAVVHLVETEAEPAADMSDLKLEHGAFRATGYAAFIRRLDHHATAYQVARVPGTTIVQVNVWDPDGNHLHIDFDESDVNAA